MHVIILLQKYCPACIQGIVVVCYLTTVMYYSYWSETVAVRRRMIYGLDYICWPHDNRGRTWPKFPDICLTVERTPREKINVIMKKYIYVGSSIKNYLFWQHTVLILRILMVLLKVVSVGCNAHVPAFLPVFKDMLETIFDRSFKIASAAFTTASEDCKRLPWRCFFRLRNRKSHTGLNPDYREGGGCTSHWFVQDIQQQHLRHAASHYRGAASSLLHLNVVFSVWYDLTELSGHPSYCYVSRYDMLINHSINITKMRWP